MQKAGSVTSPPVKILEEAAVKAQRVAQIPSLSRVDILPPRLLSDAFDDSVGDADSSVMRKYQGSKTMRHQLSFMSSLSDNFHSKQSSVYVDYGVMDSLADDTSDLNLLYEIPAATSRAQNTTQSAVKRHDIAQKRALEGQMARDFKDFQLVKQIHNGTSIMRGVTYKRGVKGSSVAQRYQANLEKIMFIKNVYEHRQFRDTYPRDLSPTNKSLAYRDRHPMKAAEIARNMLEEGSVGSFSFIHGPRQSHVHPTQQSSSTKDTTSSSTDKTSAAVIVDSLPDTPTTHQVDSQLPVVRVPMYLQPGGKVFDDTDSPKVMSPEHPEFMGVQQHQLQQLHQQHLQSSGAAPASPQPANHQPHVPKPNMQSYRAQRIYHQQQQQQQVGTTPSAPENGNNIQISSSSPVSISGPVSSTPDAQFYFPVSADTLANLPTTAAVMARSSQSNSARMQLTPQLHRHSANPSSANDVLLPFTKASDLLPETLSGLDPAVHLYPTPDSANSVDPEGQASSNTQHSLYKLDQDADSWLNMMPSGVGGTNNSASASNSGPSQPSATAVATATTALFIQQAEHPQAFLSSQMRRVKHEVHRIKTKQQLQQLQLEDEEGTRAASQSPGNSPKHSVQLPGVVGFGRGGASESFESPSPAGHPPARGSATKGPSPLSKRSFKAHSSNNSGGTTSAAGKSVESDDNKSQDLSLVLRASSPTTSGAAAAVAQAAPMVVTAPVSLASVK